jgi:hypothetical protein
MPIEPRQITLRPVGPTPARALLVRRDGTLYVSRHCRIYRSGDDGATWSHVTEMPLRLTRRIAEMSRLASRLLRHEVKALGLLSDGSCVAADRTGVFHAAPGEPVMRCCEIEDDGRPVKAPMTITVGPDDRVLWGEYNSKTGHNLPIRLYVSDDRGRSFQVARVFEGGSILHVHNLVYDEKLRHYWVLTGDHGDQPGIGRLSLDLKRFDWLVKGKQCYRVVEVFDFGDSLIYGTDSEKAKNAVVRLDKASGRVDRLQELDGSCIYACRFGSTYVISTTVEPSGVNASRDACLWISHDGERWEKVLDGRKDRWHPVYFQFGSLVLPRGESDKEVLLVSGQAIEGLDGRAFVATLPQERRQ